MLAPTTRMLAAVRCSDEITGGSCDAKSSVRVLSLAKLPVAAAMQKVPREPCFWRNLALLKGKRVIFGFAVPWSALWCGNMKNENETKSEPVCVSSFQDLDLQFNQGICISVRFARSTLPSLRLRKCRIWESSEVESEPQILNQNEN